MSQEFEFTDDAGDPLDLTGVDVVFEAREARESTSAVFTLTEGAGVTTTPLVGHILVEKTATAAYAGLTMVYDLQFTTGTLIETQLTGRLQWTEDVARA